MATKKACERFIEEVHKYGDMKQTGVSLRYMLEFGSVPSDRNMIIAAQFLHKELPIRIARRAVELDSLPFGLSNKPAVLKIFYDFVEFDYMGFVWISLCGFVFLSKNGNFVRDWYLDSFRDLRSFPEIKDINDEKEFTQMIKMIKVRHNNVVPAMALGVQQLKKSLDPKLDYEDFDEVHQFLDRFYMSRIGIRMLIGQHVEVRDWYLDSFRDLRSFPEIKDINDEKEFTQMIKMIKVRHNNVVPAMALGVQQLKKSLDPKLDYEDFDEVHQFLDRFYMSRIGIRMLIGQHVEVHDPNPPPNRIGYIHTKLSPTQVAKDASEDARYVCLREYGSAPEINIYGDPSFTFAFEAVSYFVLMKTLRLFYEQVSDEGGGIPRSGLPKIFTYLYSTADNPINERLDDGAGADVVTMAGYGYGLPISRLYARYFGGDLQIISMEGYGTDAYLHLSRLGDSQEPLP
ncbi:pyruvate dehydrogenase (acetyl-transferring) kinase, mitochondrial [Artemisia annua]|uniref:Protein-serine/threonine kinase n=1 Tax=Artemisia annua TaxID=35608 RepID=A0A2U1PCP4_ARTAN|nr:pyruvate dehydrogenase (acetyl-transferring) kinase, mitochondrial [Artemisia annua]